MSGIATASVRSVGTAAIAIPWELAAVMVGGAFAVTGITAVLTTLSVTRPRPIRLAAARE
jgi:putative ABC transport system permease protein